MIESMRVDGPGWVGLTSRAQPRGTQAGFAVPEPAGAFARAKASEATTGVSLDGMLALQEAVDADERDRKARRHGQALLSALAGLQRMLLAGDDILGALHCLADLAGVVPSAADPRLAATLHAIVLRARVELARHAP